MICANAMPAALLAVGGCLLLAVAAAPATKEMEILMPAVSPQKEDTYLCTAVKLSESRYIREFSPQHAGGHAHHIILAGCAQPGSDKKVWNCGEMLAADAAAGDSQLEVAPQCASGTKMLYAYAMEAPGLTLPPGVAFGVGEAFDTPYLVVQVHYKNADDFVKDKTLKDSSGVRLAYQLEPSAKLGGVHLSLTGGAVPAHSVTYLQASCSYDGTTPLHPFAFRAHTHSHGRVVSGFRVRGDNWKLIGSANPQLPQMFYPVNNSATVRPGDSIAARCVMENTGDTDVSIGATQQDEMCNFYMMYWIPAAAVGKDGARMCDSAAGEAALWNSAPGDAAAASATVPGTERVFQEFDKEIGSLRRQLDDAMERLDAEFSPSAHSEAEMGGDFDGDEWQHELPDERDLFDF